MSKQKQKYYPDYSALYPGVEISSKILKSLRQSDRKMKYSEYDLKCERLVVDEETGAATFLPSREDSLDRLMDEHKQFRDETATPEDLVLDALYIQELRRCIALLESDERALIQALFYGERTEQDCAKVLGIDMTQQGISKHKHKILEKLRKFLKFKIF